MFNDMTRSNVDSLKNLLALTELLENADKFKVELKKLRDEFKKNEQTLSDFIEAKGIAEYKRRCDMDIEADLAEISKKEVQLEKGLADLAKEKKKFNESIKSKTDRLKDKEAKADAALAAAEASLGAAKKAEAAAKKVLADHQKALDSLNAERQEFLDKREKIRKLNSEL